MKLIAMIVVLLVAGGCTTMKPVEMSSDQLQRKISAGEMVKVGDFVKITTSDGKNHTFKVSAVTSDHVSGKGIEIPVESITAIQPGKFSAGKMVLYVVLGLGLLYVIGTSGSGGPFFGSSVY